MAKERKIRISDAVMAFQNDDFYKNGLKLFQTLGYNTSRNLASAHPTYKDFNENFDAENQGFNKKRAIVNEWKEIQLLFQLTATEMIDQLPMFQPTVNRDEPASFLFFAIELSGSEYSRSKLADIAREINKPFKMDVFLLFKYGAYITFSLIERRPNKKFYDKDVIEKVTHIYNIKISKPHAAHIHILDTFSFEGIEAETRRKKLENFRDLQVGWKKVVSTQILNKQFYVDYKNLSVSLIRAIHPKQVGNKLIAHQGVLNLLNRIMFIYFVQKKKWIMGDDNFILNFWQDYLKEGLDGKNLFHEKWLNSVFFSAFNGQAYKSPKALAALPEPYKSALIYFPYLNGGLFTFHNEYDEFILPDKLFHQIFKFFEGYIFTIAEDTPYDVNLEISPELLGKMYEGMINATDLDDVDAEHGIIYTERPEINFMVRRSLVEVLDKKLNTLQQDEFSREFLYHFIFDTHEEKIQLLKKTKNDVRALRKVIATFTACDPACGSGSMILGIIQVQMELLKAIDAFLGNPHSHQDDFTIKKQLISECIYGVDIKEWAVRIAELRLWLYMIAEAEFENEELTKEPLLPNLDFKLRQGNSLLQKFGDLNFAVEDLFKGKHKTTGAARKLNEYIKKKKAFILNQADSKSTYENLKQEEKAVFLDLIQEMIIEKEMAIDKRKMRQGSMFGGATQKDLFEEETISLKNEIEQFKKMRQFIYKEKRLPFSFDIDFMEVFLVNEDDPGFDLVIGNPPYVKESEILPSEDAEYLEFLMEKDDNGRYKNKKEKKKVNSNYKEILNEKIYSIYPFLTTDFETIVDGKKTNVSVYGKKVNGKSDLYVYFQIICPKYLNKNGTFCFIISNSWLDVDFGAFVQQFLLKHTNIFGIYDCCVRSFDAGVNTIIYLHDNVKYPALQGGRKTQFKIADPVNNVVRFVMNKIDYTQAAYAPLLIDQENCNLNTLNELYRILPVSQKELYEIGYDEDELKYTGEKWFGLFFKAPEIFIHLNSNRNFLPLSTFGEISLGLTSCQNDFFYVSPEIISEYGIENKFLKPIFKSPQESVTIAIDNKHAFYKVFVCGISKKELRNTNALKYIQYGERSNVDEVACLQGRALWYHVGNPEKANIILPYSYGEVFKTHYSLNGIICDKRLVSFMPFDESKKNYFSLLLNSTVWFLFLETYGSGNLGEGALVFNTKNFRKLKLPVLDYDFGTVEKIQDSFFVRQIKDIFTELGFDRTKPIMSQTPKPLPDRKVLDDIVFDALNLTTDERNEVYWGVAELVKQRIDKSNSR